jgi:hypothetical protein
MSWRFFPRGRGSIRISGNAEREFASAERAHTHRRHIHDHQRWSYRFSGTISVMRLRKTIPESATIFTQDVLMPGANYGQPGLIR